MPTYEYRCADCDKGFETRQKITADPLTTCPHCGKEMLRRGPGGGIGLQFKGSGFYKTDYCCDKKSKTDPCSETHKSSCAKKEECSCKK